VAGEQTPVGTPRGGARRGAKPKRRLQPRLLLLGLASFVALLGWAVLVWQAIDAGRSARGGDSGRWGYLAAASVGAVACLFLSLWLGTLLLRGLGIIEDRRAVAPTPDEPHRH
jgi:hypothetical protein